MGMSVQGLEGGLAFTARGSRLYHAAHCGFHHGFLSAVSGRQSRGRTRASPCRSNCSGAILQGRSRYVHIPFCRAAEASASPTSAASAASICGLRQSFCGSCLKKGRALATMGERKVSARSDRYARIRSPASAARRHPQRDRACSVRAGVAVGSRGEGSGARLQAVW